MPGVQIISLACDSKLPRCGCWGLVLHWWRQVARRQEGRRATPSSNIYKPLDALTHDAPTLIASLLGFGRASLNLTGAASILPLLVVS